MNLVGAYDIKRNVERNGVSSAETLFRQQYQQWRKKQRSSGSDAIEQTNAFCLKL